MAIWSGSKYVLSDTQLIGLGEKALFSRPCCLQPSGVYCWADFRLKWDHIDSDT